jgi:hypothetical protein
VEPTQLITQQHPAGHAAAAIRWRRHDPHLARRYVQLFTDGFVREHFPARRGDDGVGAGVVDEDSEDPPAGGNQHRQANPQQLDDSPAHRGGGAATRYASVKAGTTRRACSILVRKPKPTRTPTKTSHLVLAVSMARTVA